jgi:hypothetical protein
MQQNIVGKYWMLQNNKRTGCSRIIKELDAAEYCRKVLDAAE